MNMRTRKQFSHVDMNLSPCRPSLCATSYSFNISLPYNFRLEGGENSMGKIRMVTSYKEEGCILMNLYGDFYIGEAKIKRGEKRVIGSDN